MAPPNAGPVCKRENPRLPSHFSKMAISTVWAGGSKVAELRSLPHRPLSHSSKTVLSTVHFGGLLSTLTYERPYRSRYGLGDSPTLFAVRDMMPGCRSRRGLWN